MELIAFLIVAYLVAVPLAALILVLQLRGRVDKLQKTLDQARSTSPAGARPVALPPPLPKPETRANPTVTSPPEGTPQPAAQRPSPRPPVAARRPASPPQAPVQRERLPAAKAIPFLREIGMVPPSTAGRSRESVIMQWWLPRIGGLLALLTALFFGVYINRSASPAVKFAELLAVSLGVCALGRFLERKHTGFGAVLLVTGLIMIYLTSVSAYLLPAVRVIQSPVVGAIAQSIALALIVGVGLKRRSEGIVLLAYHFGFILSVFMAWEGLREGALIAAFFLLGSGVFISRVWRFHKLPWVIIPAVFLVAPAFAFVGLFHPIETPHDLSVHLFLNAALLVAPALYLFGGLAQVTARRTLVAVATSGAIFGAFTYFRSFSPEALEPAALFLGLHLLGWALCAWTRERYAALTQLFLIKGSSLLSIWVILAYAGDLRWMILAIQSLVLAFSARHAKRLSVEITVFVVALTSIYFFATGGGNLPPAGTLLWWIVAVYPAVLVLVGLVMLPGMEAGQAPGRPFRRWLYLMIPVVACALWFPIFEGTPHRSFAITEAFTVVTFATALPALTPFLSRYLCAATSALAFALSCIAFWAEPYSVGVVLGLVVWAMAAVRAVSRVNHRFGELAESAVYALCIPAITLWVVFVTDAWAAQGVIVFALAAGLLTLGRLPWPRHLGTFTLLVPAVFLLEGSGHPPGTWTVLTMVAGLIWIALPVVDKSIHQGIGWARSRHLWTSAASTLLWMRFLSGSGTDFGWFTWQFIAVALAGVFLLASGFRRHPGLFVGGILFTAGAVFDHLTTLLVWKMDLGVMPWGWEALASMAILVVALGGWHLFAPKPWTAEDKRAHRFEITSSFATGLIIFALSSVTFRYERLSWIHYYTPLLAATAFALILVGLFYQDKPLRYVGLGALLFPLGRLFIVDVQDALHRIIAFGAAAVLLTLLGYLYHVLSKRVEGEHAVGAASDPTAKTPSS